jgi:hypothetical protein
MQDGFTLAGRSLRPQVDPLTGSDRAWPDSQPTGGDPEGAGGGSQPPEGNAPLEEGRPGAARERVQDDPDDEDFDVEETDESGNPLDSETRLKKVANALKRSKKKLSMSRADRQRLKELREQGLSLDDLVYRARQHQDFEAQAAKNPAIRKLFLGETEAEEPRKPADPEFAFDESALGFDPNLNAANRAIADGLKRGARAEFLVEQLTKGFSPAEIKQRLDRIEGTTQAQARGSIEKEWNGTIRAAADEITDPAIRRMFVDSMVTAKQQFGGKRPASFFVDHYLKDLKIGRAEKARATAAAADAGAASPQQTQRTAERVAQLPRFGGLNSTPAPAKKGGENLADVRRRLTGQRPRG